jgi:DNA-binding MarR family transcriptional regulator
VEKPDAGKRADGRGEDCDVTTGAAPLDEADYRDAAALREALRRFYRSSEQIAVANGLTPQRQLLLLLIRGAPGGSGRATVTDLAERMQLAQNTVTDLVRRAEEAGLVAREPSPVDGRVTYLALTDEGERRLAGTVGALRDDRARLIELVRGLDGG